MELIGRTTINPFLFYTGKIAGYLTWIIFLLSALKIDIIVRNDFLYNDFVALLILTIGMFFIVLSLINLGRSVRLGLPSESTVLKTNGLYRISRNPMYFGFNLLTISSVLYMFNLLILMLGLYSILIYHLIIKGEENFLNKRFGEPYSNYKKSVRRYI